jgi:hypothetical protein
MVKSIPKQQQQLGKYDRFKGSLKRGKEFSKKHKKKIAAVTVIALVIAACATNAWCASQASILGLKLKAAAASFPSAFGKFATKAQNAAKEGPKKLFKVVKDFLASLKGKTPEVPGADKEGFFKKAKGNIYGAGATVAGGLKFAEEAQKNISMAKSLKSTATSLTNESESQGSFAPPPPPPPPQKSKRKKSSKKSSKKTSSRKTSSRKRRRRRSSRKRRSRSRKRRSRSRKRSSRKRRRRRRRIYYRN